MRVRISNAPGGWRDAPSCTPTMQRSLGGMPVGQAIPAPIRRVTALKGGGHGRAFDYIAGCRCDLCRAAHRAVEDIARERRKARG